MQIVGFDVDTLAGGTGKAHISFLSKELLKTQHRMNPAKSTGQSGTGTLGGWKYSEMRTYIKERIKPLIPSNVQSAIVEVNKTHASYTTSGNRTTQTSQDDLWIPSYTEEIKNADSLYGSIFIDDDSRIKRLPNEEKGKPWWTRSANSPESFLRVGTSGGYSNSTSTNLAYICLGFCL